MRTLSSYPALSSRGDTSPAGPSIAPTSGGQEPKYSPTQRINQKQSCYYHLHAKDEILEVLACVSHPHSSKKRPRQEQISSRGREELQEKKLLFAPKQSNCVSLRFIQLAHSRFSASISSPTPSRSLGARLTPPEPKGQLHSRVKGGEEMRRWAPGPVPAQRARKTARPRPAARRSPSKGYTSFDFLNSVLANHL